MLSDFHSLFDRLMTESKSGHFDALVVTETSANVIRSQLSVLKSVFSSTWGVGNLFLLQSYQETYIKKRAHIRIANFLMMEKFY